jgi:hypothetical protein
MSAVGAIAKYRLTWAITAGNGDSAFLANFGAKLAGSLSCSTLTATRRYRLVLLHVLLQQAQWVAPDCFRDYDEFDDIDASLAAFDLGYERLRLAQPVRQLLLNDPGIYPSLFQHAEKAGVVRRVEGLAHAPSGERRLAS